MPQAERLRAAVAGATGYIGMQCTALLAAHPDVELTRVLGHSSAGKRYCDVVPGSRVELTIQDSLDPGSVDVVMADAADLVKVEHTLRQIVNVKGD